MAVLKGEGRVPILFGSWALPVPPNRSAYIARPDEQGEHPTVVIAHGASGITPGVKAVARHLARHRFSVLVPDLTRGVAGGDDDFEWAVGDLVDAVISADLPGVAWASSSRMALLGLGEGGVPACIVASEEPVRVLVLGGASLDPDLLGSITTALYVLHGSADEVTPEEEVRALQSAVGTGEWILYPGAGADFVDESAPGFEPWAASDALDRIVAAFDRHLGVVHAG